MKEGALHHKLLAIVLRLPGAYEDRPWGSVHCKVDGKIFCGWGEREDGSLSVGFKTDKELQGMLLTSDPRFTMAAYVGKHGWVDMRVGPKPDLAELEHFIVDSYRMIAPKKRIKELDAAAAPAKKTAAAKKKPVSKPKKASKRAKR
jgi:predicted DNA-binding protein (MmcQ/YjbR family)